MNLQSYPVDMNYVYDKLQEHVGSFLEHFLHACMHADGQNYELLRPALLVIMQRYPLRGGEKNVGTGEGVSGVLHKLPSAEDGW